MSLGSRIKERREFLQITRNELAVSIGVTQSAIANYENEISTPRVELLYKLFEALQCDANYLYQDEIQSIKERQEFSQEEKDLIYKYRQLDQHGVNVVEFVLSEEYKRCTMT